MSVIAIILLIVLVAIAMLFSGCTSKENVKTLNVNDFVIAHLSGYEEYGSVTFEVDYERMFDKLPISNSTKRNSAETAKNFSLFTADYQKSDTLRNGDEIAVTWMVNEDVLKELEQSLKVDIVSDDYKYVVRDLDDVQEFNPFDYLNIDTKHTVSGKGELYLSIYCINGDEEFLWNVEHDGENGKIRNGDVLNLTITDDIDMDEFTKATGWKITKTNDTFIVDVLGRYATNSLLLNSINEETKDVFAGVINDWVVAGLNDENVLADHRQPELHGYLFYTNAEQGEHDPEYWYEIERYDENDNPIIEEDIEPTEGMLFAIYHIEDNYIQDGYYVFIGLKGVFSCDADGIYLNNGDPIPESFVHYEKETIRYNASGWQQGSEEMGFLYLGAPYAGHRDIQETFAYIEKTYGKDYAHRFTNGYFLNIVPNRETIILEGED